MTLPRKKAQIQTSPIFSIERTGLTRFFEGSPISLEQSPGESQYKILITIFR